MAGPESQTRASELGGGGGGGGGGNPLSQPRASPKQRDRRVGGGGGVAAHTGGEGVLCVGDHETVRLARQLTPPVLVIVRLEHKGNSRTAPHTISGQGSECTQARQHLDWTQTQTLSCSWDTLCFCEAYGVRPMNKENKQKPPQSAQSASRTMKNSDG